MCDNKPTLEDRIFDLEFQLNTMTNKLELLTMLVNKMQNRIRNLENQHP
jgi:uncharacterized coiled-coil protein SlyX